MGHPGIPYFETHIVIAIHQQKEKEQIEQMHKIMLTFGHRAKPQNSRTSLEGCCGLRV